MPVSQLDLVSTLCVDCGLCCNGTLFDVANIREDERDFAASLGLKVTTGSDGTGAGFALPCPHLCGAACTIYDQPRPSVCSAFFCRLAHALDDGETSLDAAQERVAKAKALLGAIKPLLREGEDIAAARDRWRRLKGQFSPGSNEAQLHAAMVALNLYLHRNFRLPGDPLFNG
ncbi:MAG: hypothetical protein KGL44_11520 [Sphingomonadales bacterium]|nr:hypothetical protein [Sphingomonadales bacterium]